MITLSELAALFVVSTCLLLLFFLPPVIKRERERQEKKQIRRNIREAGQSGVATRYRLETNFDERKYPYEKSVHKWNSDGKTVSLEMQLVPIEDDTHEVDSAAIEAMLATESSLAENWLSEEDNDAYGGLGDADIHRRVESMIKNTPKAFAEFIEEIEFWDESQE